MNKSKPLAVWEQSGCVCVCVCLCQFICLQGGHYRKAGSVMVCVNTLSAISTIYFKDWLWLITCGVCLVRYVAIHNTFQCQLGNNECIVKSAAHLRQHPWKKKKKLKSVSIVAFPDKAEYNEKISNHVCEKTLWFKLVPATFSLVKVTVQVLPVCGTNTTLLSASLQKDIATVKVSFTCAGL